MQKKPLLFIAFVAICVLAIGGGNAIRKAVDPSVKNTPSTLFAGLGRAIKGTVTARLGYGSADADNPKQVRRGAQVYAAHCAACHGEKLQGQQHWRTRQADGSLPAPPHDATGHTWHHSDKLLFDYTKKGGQATIGQDFKSGMPGFEEVLKDSDIWSVLAYIKSTWPAKIRKNQAARNKTN